MTGLIPRERIETKILLIRGQKVMLDRHLAELYGVKTKALNQAVKRNTSRFPKDFMFQLTKFEAQKTLGSTSPFLRSQIVTLKRGQHVKHLPYAFTEQGIAMLSSVLKSEKAVQVNIAIMRIFVALKNSILSNKALSQKLEQFENKLKKQDEAIKSVFEAIRQLMAPPKQLPRKIGFIK